MRLKTFLTSFFISISIGFAQISGEDVIAKMMENPSPSDIKMNFKMTLFSNSKEKKNKKHFRLMEQIEKRYQDGEFKSKLLLRFIEPKEVRGLSLLNWSRIDQKNDDQWLYIPKFGLGWSNPRSHPSYSVRQALHLVRKVTFWSILTYPQGG